MKVRVRLAPSPTGTLHLGTARTALFNWLFAKKEGGSFLLRIEDTDFERSKEEYIKNIYDGLQWLGIDWNESPVIQSKRVNEHKAIIKTLIDKGFAYRCYASESELEEMRETQKENGLAPRYDNRHRFLTPEQESNFINEGRNPVIRFKINDQKLISWNDLIRGEMTWSGKDLGGDMVIARRAPADSIGDPLYNLVVVADDSAMKISHVIRGEDHIANTAKQILLYEALDLNIPTFAHTPLILNSEGKKLSKRDGVTSISEFKEMGYTSEAMANYMTLLGWAVPEGTNERFKISEISSVFSFEKVNKASAKFDWDKLNWLNSQVIHEMSPKKLLNYLDPLFKKNEWNIPSQEWGENLLDLIAPSMILINDGVDQAKPFFEEPTLNPDGKKQLELKETKVILKFILENLKKSDSPIINEEKAHDLLNQATKICEVKKGLVMKSLRAALFGTLNGPDLIKSWVLLSRLSKDRPRISRFI
ncbi:glutamate--tRNA ligase [Prochlorococcus marinus]|uniref:Glutamate--tRNA ligase n=1 Tax=Prochlorococcus marinus XMU1408 TaxID=2213228 RepID=A0A318R9E7_PROMR|nr:glutamate--tRNA ligase [Prochlorococcus marinus]MBW3041501.1 glutamate--tRNA ligase [Prochlorococcus marinus str. XMU1408]PYE02659.1 glutamate--tRNA ligase [Prochlorococcus marinus XMU1408]